MTIDQQDYSKDLILIKNRVISPWWRKEGHRLDIQDLENITLDECDILIIGTGAFGVMRVPDETKQSLSKHIEQLYIERTGKAWSHYNELRKNHRVCAAFHLSC